MKPHPRDTHLPQQPSDPAEDYESHVLQSWHQNAAAWTQAVQHDQIVSRTLVTNQAIVDAVMDCAPSSVLDLGCGEGWLARALSCQGVDVLGVDAVAALVQQARQRGGASFRVSSYDHIVMGSLQADAPFDLIVCNFSLFGHTSVRRIVAYLPRLLSPKGHFIIQTLHPDTVGEGLCQDGWLAGSWQGFNQDFRNPAPWYFRTLNSWQRLLAMNGWVVDKVLTPLDPRTQQSASVIFVNRLAASVRKV